MLSSLMCLWILWRSWYKSSTADTRIWGHQGVEALEARQIICKEEKALTRVMEDSSKERRRRAIRESRWSYHFITFTSSAWFIAPAIWNDFCDIMTQYHEDNGRDVVGGEALQDKLSGWWLFRDWWSSICSLLQDDWILNDIGKFSI